MTPLGHAAIALARKGMRVFPLAPRKKEPPLLGGWQIHATTDPGKIANWWSREPNNIGIACGEGSGIWVLDVDGSEGETTLRRLEAEARRVARDGRSHHRIGPASLFSVANRHRDPKRTMPG